MLKKSKEAVEEEASKSESDAEDEEVAYGFVIYNDKPDALAAVAKDGYALMYVSAALRDDKQVVMAAVSRTGLALRWASPGIQRDQEVVLTAVAQNCFAMEHAAPQLQGDKSFVLPTVSKFGGAFLYVSPKMQGIKEVALAAISAPVPTAGGTAGGALLQYASAKLQKDKAFVMEAVAKDAFALHYASAELQVTLPTAPPRSHYI